MTQALAIALALVIAGSGTAIWWIDRKLEAANDKVTKAEGALGREEQSRKGFEATAEACSKSVAGIQAAAKSLVAGYQRRLAASQAKTADAEALVDQLLTKARPVGLDECQATIRELDEEIDRRRMTNDIQPDTPEIDDRHPDRG